MLPGATLNFCDLTAASLEECKLGEASLFAVTVHHARFHTTDLTSSLLAHAQGFEAQFQDANLNNANLSFANFTGSNFNGAGMSGIYEHETVFDGASFEGTMR